MSFDKVDGTAATSTTPYVEGGYIITIEEDGSGGSYLQKSDTTGFELQLLGSVTDQWFVSAGYTSLDANSPTGVRLREAPENMFSIWNNYTVSDRLA